MKKNYSLIFLVSLCFILSGYGQIYQHDFGTTTISAHPYNVAPGILDANLSNSSWSNSTGSWTSFGGSAGQAISLSNSSGTPTITLTFDVNSGYQLDVTSFSFWRRRSNTGAQNWSMTINGIAVGSGTVPTTGADIGNTTVSNAVSGLTGTITVQISLSGAEATGTFRLDDFTLNGSVSVSCTPTQSLTSFAPTEGPIGTVVTIIGDDFSDTTSVDFNGTASANIAYVDSDADGIIDTLLAEVPTGTTTGNITITESGCPITSASPFTVTDTSGGCISSNLSNLIITEIYDKGSGSLGYIEIYNGTGSAVNLSGYSIRRYGDLSDVGAVPDNYTLYTFPATTPTINNNQVLFGEMYSPGNTDSDTTPDFTFDIDCSNTNPSNPSCGGFNGDDVFHLYDGATVIDVYENPNASTGYTILRDTNTAGPSPTSNPGDWTYSGSESVADLGTFIYTGSTISFPSTTNPSTVSGNCIDTVSFTSNGTASAGGALTYQWYFNDGVSATWSTVSGANLPLTTVTGATGSTLTLTGGIYHYDNYQFYCLVIEDGGSCSTMSNAAQLKIGTATWNGTNWIWNDGTDLDTLPSLSSNVVLDNNFNTSVGGLQQSFSACNLTINNGSTLTINDGHYAQIQNDVVNNGTVSISTAGSLVQINDTGTYTLNPVSGINSLSKSTSFLQYWYEYTYWSSPLQNAQIETALFTSNPNRRHYFDASLFNDILTETANTNTFISGNDDIDDEGDDWVDQSTGNMIPGRGYATTHNNIAFTPNSYLYIFEGNSSNGQGGFNNGEISLDIYIRPEVLPLTSVQNYNDWNFIGNPYPSAIDASIFFSHTSPFLEGVIYLWSHVTNADSNASGDENANFSKNDYAMLNYVGGIAAGTPAPNDNPSNIPNGYIASGQGFFVIGNKSYASSGAGYYNETVFNNSMRVVDNNDQFFRTATHNKLWINLTSDNGVFNQILVGYVDGATDNEDAMSYDALRNLSTGVNSMLYSVIPNSDKKFAIQGKSPSSLSTEEVIPLGFYTVINEPTIYTLSIAQLEGDFMNQNSIYVIDRLNNIIHELSMSDYSFTSETGEFNDRFEIVFTPQALSIDDHQAGNNDLTIIELPNGDVQFSVGENHTIINVEILDVLGRRIYSLKGNNATEVYTLSKLSKAPYIAKVTLSNGQTISKKAIKRK